MDKTPWDQIADEHSTTRKNIKRIIQGSRWRQFHPQVAPELYGANNDEEKLVATEGFVLPPTPAGLLALHHYIGTCNSLGEAKEASKAQQAHSMMLKTHLTTG